MGHQPPVLKLVPVSASFAKAGGGEFEITLRQYYSKVLFNQLSTKSSRTLGALLSQVQHQEARKTSKVLLVANY